MAHKAKVSHDSTHGLYHRSVGKTATGTKPKFWLGSDEKEATRRADRLEMLWEEVKRDWQQALKTYHDFLGTKLLTKPASPQWDEMTLAIAKVVAKGGMSFPLPRNPAWSAYNYTLKITDVQRRFTVVSFTPE